MEQGQDAVRIMTVHGAKGLQAPIVFLPDTVRLPKLERMHFWNADDSFLLWSLSQQDDDAVMSELRTRDRAAMMEEYRRLLYVALTRAEDELYICGWKGKKEEKGIVQESWYALAEAAVLPHAIALDEGWKRWRIENDIPRKVIQATTPVTKVLPGAPPAHLLMPALMEAPEPQMTPSAIQASVTGNSSQSGGKRRGMLVHRLLELLPAIAADRRVDAARHYLESSLPAEEAQRLALEVMSVLQHPDFAHVFDGDSKAEVPVVGRITMDGRQVMVSGQIDRLLIADEGIWIIDYKTDRHVPAKEADIPAAYRRQLSLYRRLLMDIYPDRPVRCALLWTAAPKLMEIGHLD